MTKVGKLVAIAREVKASSTFLLPELGPAPWNSKVRSYHGGGVASLRVRIRKWV